MLKREPRRVQELALEAELDGTAVQRVAGDGQVDRGEMHADLMRAPGLECHAQQRMTRQQLFDLEMRHRVARRIGVERLAKCVMAIAPDRCLDRAAQRARPPDDECQVLARELSRLYELLQAPV